MTYFKWNDNCYADLNEAVEDATKSLAEDVKPYWEEHYCPSCHSSFRLIRYSIHTSYKRGCIEVILRKKCTRKDYYNGVAEEEKNTTKIIREKIEILENIPLIRYQYKTL